MRKKIKKAFTLVELLVVIAILAILATVSIVGYNSFTKKAKVSNDTALVSQLNTLLKADSMVNGDAKTPTDALKITSEAGYDVEKLTPTASDYDIIWNQAVNQFALLDEKGTAVYGEKSTEEYKNWKFVSEYNTAKDYSVYLKGTAFTGDLEVKAGIDVGNNTNVNTINYKNDVAKDDVVIRTNGGTLNIDAANDTITHYGIIDNAIITAVAKDSYHEYGTVKLLQLKEGHIVAENNSNISQISISDGTNLKLDVNENANVTIVTSENELSDGVVNIKNSNTALVIKSTNNYVAFVGANGYTSLSDAIESAKSGQTVVLMKDCTLSNSISTTITSKNLSIDINGCNFTFNSFNLDTENGTQKTTETLKFFDTSIVKGKMVSKSSIAIYMGPNDTVLIDGVTLECPIYGIFLRGHDANLSINSSNITASVYAIATNASTIINGGVSMSIDNSVIETKSNDQDNTAIQINVESNSIIKNSTIKGQRQALMFRGGTARIENSIIEKTGTKASENYSDYSDESNTWGEGNQVPAYALVLGNRNENAYQYATNVSLYNTTVIGKVYCWGNSKAGIETTVTFEDNNHGEIIIGENVIVNGKLDK